LQARGETRHIITRPEQSKRLRAPDIVVLYKNTSNNKVWLQKRGMFRLQYLFFRKTDLARKFESDSDGYANADATSSPRQDRSDFERLHALILKTKRSFPGNINPLYDKPPPSWRVGAFILKKTIVDSRKHYVLAKTNAVCIDELHARSIIS